MLRYFSDGVARFPSVLPGRHTLFVGSGAGYHRLPVQQGSAPAILEVNLPAQPTPAPPH